MITFASQRVAKNPPQSVKVVAKIVADCAGSNPNFFIANGIDTPVTQAFTWFNVNARQMTKPSNTG